MKKEETPCQGEDKRITGLKNPTTISPPNHYYGLQSVLHYTPPPSLHPHAPLYINHLPSLSSSLRSLPLSLTMTTFISPLLSLLLLLISFTSTLATCNVPSDKGNTLQILHAFGPCSPLHPKTPPPSWEDYLLELLSQDQSRLSYLSSLATAKRSFVPIASGTRILQTPTYVVRANVGTPPHPMLVAIDTSSDTAWIPSSSCIGCPQMSTVYTPDRSSTYKPVRCGSPQCFQVPNPSCPSRSPSCLYNFTYGSSSVLASLSQDSLALSSDIVKDYTFGSIVQATGTSVLPQGLLGLGRGPLSFLSQTKSLYNSVFSYCLPNFRSLNFSGTLRLGPSGQPMIIKTTPLLSNPRRSSLYYVNLQRIRVGRKYVNIPTDTLAFNPTTGAGTIFDSGTMFTRLVAPAYTAVRDEFRRRVAKPVTTLGGFDTCYNGPIRPPTISFEFVGMNMTLPHDNMMIHSSSSDLSCLAMAAAPDNVNSVLNVIANMQQQNHRILFDVPNGRVGVAREVCTRA